MLRRSQAPTGSYPGGSTGFLMHTHLDAIERSPTRTTPAWVQMMYRRGYEAFCRNPRGREPVHQNSHYRAGWRSAQGALERQQDRPFVDMRRARCCKLGSDHSVAVVHADDIGDVQVGSWIRIQQREDGPWMKVEITELGMAGYFKAEPVVRPRA